MMMMSTIDKPKSGCDDDDNFQNMMMPKKLGFPSFANVFKAKEHVMSGSPENEPKQ
jgi:hypothetical protein